MIKNSQSKQHQIVVAASNLVSEDGVGQFTLEAVAAAAGVSKGGLLYHFPNKEALIEGMIDIYLNDFEAELEQIRTGLPEDQHGRWLCAYVIASFEDVIDSSLVSAALAAIANQPELLQRLGKRYDLWLAHAIDDGVSPMTATLVMLATDGMWYTQTFGLNTTERVGSTQIRDYLLRLIAEDRT
ncbi:MAG: TetR/AcrR family transcriptional regulator [Aggregatilineales bacterium]